MSLVFRMVIHDPVTTDKGRELLALKLMYLKSGIHGAHSLGVPRSIIQERAVAYVYHWLELYGNNRLGIESTIRGLANECDLSIVEFMEECCEEKPMKSISELMAYRPDLSAF